MPAIERQRILEHHLVAHRRAERGEVLLGDGDLRLVHVEADRPGQQLADVRAGEVGQRLIGDAGRAIGVAVANLCNLLNPECVIVGGDLSAAGEVLLGPLREAARVARGKRVNANVYAMIVPGSGLVKEQAEAERARERARMLSGEMTEAEAIERLDAWEKAGEMWRADLTMARKMAGLARATGHPTGTPVMTKLPREGSADSGDTTALYGWPTTVTVAPGVKFTPVMVIDVPPVIGP